MPSKKWFPWSPPGDDLVLQRETFYPETAVRFSGDYYRCNHNCWLENDVIAAEIIESNRSYQEIATELQEVNLENIVPNIYLKYKHVLDDFQKAFKNQDDKKQK